MFKRNPRHGYPGWRATLESLEPRTLLAAGDWSNAPLVGDVDRDGLVHPLDALLVINNLNDLQTRSLDQARGASERALDVNGDGHCTALDLLLIINLLNEYTIEPYVIARLPSDLDGNGIVLTERVELQGMTLPRTSVKVAVNQVELASFTADEEGAFSVWLDLPQGVSNVQVQTRDPRGRVAVGQMEVRVGDGLHNWNATALNVIRVWSAISNDPYQGRIVTSQPPMVARNLAMIHVAAYDAMNSIEALKSTEPRFKNYLEHTALDAHAQSMAAALTAAFEVSAGLYADPDELALWSAALAEGLAVIPNDSARATGIEVGKQVARLMLNNRAQDGTGAGHNYEADWALGVWQRTYPDFLPPLLPQWPVVRPFVVSDVTTHRSPPPPELDSQAYAAAVEQVMQLGGLNSLQRTAEQTEIALFWADGGGTATPPGHWNRIATDASLARSLAPLENARMYALMNLALADAGIASWDTKYAYALWRPIEAIRRADEDGNAATVPASDWLPLLKTPPFPSYTSGHSTFSGAAATVLTALLGDSVAFASSIDPQNAPAQRPLAAEQIIVRQFSSFWDAAEEAGISRIYGGIHFNFDNTAGLELGKQIGLRVLHFMGS